MKKTQMKMSRILKIMILLAEEVRKTTKQLKLMEINLNMMVLMSNPKIIKNLIIARATTC